MDSDQHWSGKLRNRMMLAVMLMIFAGLAPTLRADEQRAGIEMASWLQGCWHSQRGEQTVEEHWMSPLGRSMLGMGRTVRGGALVAYELTVLREQAERLTYQAFPSGQASALFTSTVVAPGRIVFENPQHDFPQRIGYEQKGDGVTAWIEGTRNGQLRRIEFAYTRAVCGPTAVQ